MVKNKIKKVIIISLILTFILGIWAISSYIQNSEINTNYRYWENRTPNNYEETLEKENAINEYNEKQESGSLRSIVYVAGVLSVCCFIIFLISVFSELGKESKQDEIIENNNKRSNKNVIWGWMGLFIAILVVISPIISIFTLLYAYSEAVYYDLFNLYPKFYLVFIIDIVVSIFLIIFSIYAGLSLYFFKDRALFKAKLFLIVGLIYGIVAPFFG